MNRTLVRYKKGNEHFEAEIDYDAFPEGDYLLTEICTDISQGLRPSHQELETVFNTTDPAQIIEIMTAKGEILVPADVRKKVREQRWNQLVDMIQVNSVNAQTKVVFTKSIIESALHQAKVHLNEHKSVKSQFDDIIRKLRPIIPISIETKTFTIIIPGQYVGATQHLVRKNSKLLKEDWDSSGSWRIKVEVPAGFQQRLIDMLQSVAHGTIEINNE